MNQPDNHALVNDESLRPPPPHAQLKFRRFVLKLSGEALCSPSVGFGIDPETMRLTALELSEVYALGAQIGVVVGGGNIFRGLKGASAGMDRSQSDHMGMLATVINSLALQDALERVGVPTRVMSASRDASGGRALHPSSRHSSPRKGPSAHLRSRHR
ncbi:MAG: hypothetical protein U0165_10225 [Polyangiaceae bacterium]